MTAVTFAVLTTGRQDWGLLRPLCEQLRDAADFELQLLAGGMALDKDFGDTRQNIIDAGFALAAELDWDVKANPASQSAEMIKQMNKALTRLKPRALILLGDRFETLAAALAASLARIPLVHLHGGEETEGAFDNAFRHALSKLSHLHFVAHQDYAKRLLQMGEAADSVHVVGAFGVEGIVNSPALSRKELERRLGCELADPIGLVTLHPETLSGQPSLKLADAVIEVMAREAMTWIITLPNADPGSKDLRRALQQFAAIKDNVHAFDALGSENYLALLRISTLVLGNSSSAMIEAPYLHVPSINVGDRQKGRIRADSVLDVPAEAKAITNALRLAQTRAFQQKISGQEQIFGKGDAAKKMIQILQNWTAPAPPIKHFHDMECTDG